MSAINEYFQEFERGSDEIKERLARKCYLLGYNAAVEQVEELSNEAWNLGLKEKAEAFRWLAKELKGENDEA